MSWPVGKKQTPEHRAKIGAALTVPIEIRIWKFVNKRGPIPQHRSELKRCWEWTGSQDGHGYGTVSFKKKNRKAYVVMWELKNGPVPEGKELDHVCYNTFCVRPSHLEPVTHQINTQRYHDRAETCKHGHTWTPENTEIRKNGRRRCRRCHVIESMDRKRRLRALI